jgi:tetratricopeptide (TPR) repeat protein
MRKIVFLILAALAAQPALAADKPILAPPPDWVVPVEAPADTAPPDEAPMRLLLWDQQARLAADGTETHYYRSVARPQTPQGVQGLGTLSIDWSPELGDLTVHKLHLLRGDTVIDVLAKQEFTVLRRENNLESAMLNGVLTATIQPEGLQPGDILDVAYTIDGREPVLQEHVGGVLEMNYDAPIARAHLRVSWDEGVPLRWREEQLPAALTRTANSLEMTADDVQPLVPPKSAPARYLLGRHLQYSDFASWSEVADLFVPLYDEASALADGSPLEAEIARIRAATDDPVARAEAALRLVQDQVRYVYIGMDAGALAPASADTTWARRFGDCKGKTALLLALLRGLDIEAAPALVSSVGGNGLDERLPEVLWFDHIIVRARIGGEVYWLDGTRTGDRDLARLAVPGFQWALPIGPAASQLEALVPRPFDRPQIATRLHLDASKGLLAPARAKIEMVIRGDAAIGTKLGLDSLTGSERDRRLKAYWKDSYTFLEPETVETRFDPETGETVISVEGTADLKWGAGPERPLQHEIYGSRIGWDEDFEREPGPYRDVPYAVEYPYDMQIVNTIVLPRDGEGFRITGADVDRTIASMHFLRRTTLKDGVVSMEARIRTTAPEFLASEAAKAEKAIKKLGETPVLILPPSDFAPTSEDRSALLDMMPGTVEGHVAKADLHLQQAEIPEALEELGKAIELSPDPTPLLEYRASLYLDLGETELALADANAALERNPASKAGVYVRAMIGVESGDPEAAIDELTMAMADTPNDAMLLAARATAYWKAEKPGPALADSAMSLAIDPSNFRLYVIRANCFAMQGQLDRAVEEATRITDQFPHDPRAHLASGTILALTGRYEEGLAAFDRAIAIHPSETAYLRRAQYAPPGTGTMAIQADIDAALAINPSSAEALRLQALLQSEQGDYAGASTTVARLLEIIPDDQEVRAEHAGLLARAGETEAAHREFAELREMLADDPSGLNTLCWVAATAGFEMEQALADCEAALALAPENPATLDSLGFVNLRLGRLDEAIAHYDAALARHSEAPSFYGRGVAKMRKGLTEEGRQDLITARNRNPQIDRLFAVYGVTP